MEIVHLRGLDRARSSPAYEDRARSGGAVAVGDKHAQINRRTQRTPSRRRSVRVSLADDEYELLRTSAARERLALGAFVATVVMAVVRNREQPEHAVLREVLGEVMQASDQARRIGVNLNQTVAALNSSDPPPQLPRYAEAAARTVRKLDDLADEVCRCLP